ncbi:DMT family transporter [Mesorhizobium escarrei]|uniref:DMT(Drug/metabolite transporter) superfamily permease n=1 Tax=Mesorhizobium escarrei TaxID=666018 RepID=A0ABM9EAD6_9HYPH|nr:DMT family transporter [Mesorhizobium escarrei]CAH2406148.1 DMT(Drug/metabolite transporter) superfamily permease [Mesorhizobium escarrei]
MPSLDSRPSDAAEMQNANDGETPATTPDKVAELRSKRHAAWSWKRPAVSENLLASLILLAAMTSFTAMTVLIKIAGQRIPLVEILTIRQLVMQALIVPFVMTDFPAVLRTPRPMLQITRGLFQLGAMVFSFAAVIHLPLALAMALSFSYAIFVTVGASRFLKERVGRARWITTIIGIIGVFVMLRPTGSTSLLYSVVALLGAVCSAASALSLRVASGPDRATTILTYQAMVLLAALAVPTAFFWVTPTFSELLVLLLVGVSGTLGQWLLTVAYQKGQAAALAPLDFVRLLLTTICGLVFFDESLEVEVMIGALILIGATAYTFRTNARLASVLR